MSAKSSYLSKQEQKALEEFKKKSKEKNVLKTAMKSHQAEHEPAKQQQKKKRSGGSLTESTDDDEKASKKGPTRRRSSAEAAFSVEKPFRVGPSRFPPKSVVLGSEQFAHRENRSDRPFWGEPDDVGFNHYDKWDSEERSERRKRGSVDSDKK